MQRDELAATREEMKAQREEMAAQRAAQEESAKQQAAANRIGDLANAISIARSRLEAIELTNAVQPSSGLKAVLESVSGEKPVPTKETKPVLDEVVNHIRFLDRARHLLEGPDGGGSRPQ